MSIEESILDIFITWLTSGIIGIYLNNKFKISEKLTKFKHKILNSEISMILSVSYESNYPFDKIKTHILNNFRDEFGHLKIYLNNEYQLDFDVLDYGFHVIVEYNTQNELSIRTSKIIRHMNTVVKTVEDVLDACNKTKREIKTTNYTIKLDEKDFSIYLYLPYKQIFTKFYTPKQIIIKDYRIKMLDGTSGSEIKVNGEYLNINSDERSDLMKVISNFV